MVMLIETFDDGMVIKKDGYLSVVRFDDLLKDGYLCYPIDSKLKNSEGLVLEIRIKQP